MSTHFSCLNVSKITHEYIWSDVSTYVVTRHGSLWLDLWIYVPKYMCVCSKLYVYMRYLFREIYFERDDLCLCMSTEHSYLCISRKMTHVYVFQHCWLTSMHVYRRLASMYFEKDDSRLCTSTDDSYLYISSDDWCLCISRVDKDHPCFASIICVSFSCLWL